MLKYPKDDPGRESGSLGSFRNRVAWFLQHHFLRGVLFDAMTKQGIWDEIRRTVKANGGAPFGRLERDWN
jgi:hypothetical protein